MKEIIDARQYMTEQRSYDALEAPEYHEIPDDEAEPEIDPEDKLADAWCSRCVTQARKTLGKFRAEGYVTLRLDEHEQIYVEVDAYGSTRERAFQNMELALRWKLAKAAEILIEKINEVR